MAPNHRVNLTFGNRVREERTRQQISQEQLAELVNVSDDTIKRIERGQGAKLDVAYEIASALHVPVQSFLPIQEENRNERISAAQMLLEELR